MFVAGGRSGDRTQYPYQVGRYLLVRFSVLVLYYLLGIFSVQLTTLDTSIPLIPT